MEGHTGRPDRPREAAGAHRQRCVEIDGCLKRQNPAYRLTCIFRKKSGGRSFTLFLCVGHALFKWISAFSGITGPALEEQAPAGGPSRPPGTGPTPAAASSPSPPGITDRMGAPMRSVIPGGEGELAAAGVGPVPGGRDGPPAGACSSNAGPVMPENAEIHLKRAWPTHKKRVKDLPPLFFLKMQVSL